MVSNNAARGISESSEIDDSGVIWVITDRYGVLVETSREAAEMLNVSSSGLRGRQLLTFFDGQRDDWRRALGAAASGLMVDCEGAVRPREKRPRRIRAEISKTHDVFERDAVLWTFTELGVHRHSAMPAAHSASSQI
jgi:PAS domain-containing protein